MTLIKEVFSVWDRLGILDVILPFILVFAVAYGLLDKTKVLGEYAEQYNAVVAFVLGFFVVAALHLVRALQTIVQYSALFVVMVVFVTVLRRFMGGADDPTKQSYPKYLASLIIGLIAFYALGFKGWVPVSWIETVLLPLALAFGLVLLVLYFILGPTQRTTAAPSRTEEGGPVQLEHKKRITKPTGKIHV